MIHVLWELIFSLLEFMFVNIEPLYVQTFSCPSNDLASTKRSNLLLVRDSVIDSPVLANNRFFWKTLWRSDRLKNLIMIEVFPFLDLCNGCAISM